MISPFGVEYRDVSKNISREARLLYRAGEIPEKGRVAWLGAAAKDHYAGKGAAKAIARGELKPSDVNQKRYSSESSSGLPMRPKGRFAHAGKLGAKSGSKKRMNEYRRQRGRSIYFRTRKGLPSPTGQRYSGRDLTRKPQIVGLP